MKRHQSLQPISRQHHGGLLTARLLQHGAPPYKGMPTTHAAKREYVLQFYKEHLQPHFALEEATVFALAGAFSANLKQQAEQLQAEHRQLEELIKALPQTTDTALPDKLHEVGQLLERHIRQEERVFFEQLQQELPADKLRLLEEQVLQHSA
ncbi:hemerythrin domain-containing protein [Pontibacter diazotrophicus]|uniref:Hemerythrin domain-containing protein n=1 Tax=Pontibacter diazotrophicus TaxID=1400979 RepID=A0A3D8L716_9BACT|nr:hemerythrin domain-containing protein [Pontibacter diazotrophicus]RDV13174.1 hemerythrin domain-containing protein [Pontibacter diazotrophicus]